MTDLRGGGYTSIKFMSFQLSAASPRMSVSVGAADDPYKKYWWAILAGLVLTGAWLCLPIMETPVGSARVDTSKPAVDPNAESSLDSVENPNGAAGGALDLSMDGAGKRKSRSDEAIASMLYQAPPEAGAAAAGAPLGAATGSASLAQQLKSVGAKKPDDSGWGEKAQRGFAAPHLSGGGGLSGMGSASGGSSASASSGVSAFGASSAQIGLGSTRGLKDDGSADKMATGMQALRGAAQTSMAAAAAKSNDAARGGSGAMFDGSKGQNAGIGGPAGGDNGAYSALDAAPTNLKINDPKLMDKKELKDPPAADVPTAAGGNDMAKQLAMMAATAVIGGLIPGVGGQMAMMMGMMMMQQQQAKADAESAKRQQDAQKRMGV